MSEGELVERLKRLERQNCRLRRAGFLAVVALGALVLTGQVASQSGEQPSRLMTPTQDREFLASLKTDLTRWQAQLTEIDVGALGVDFKKGKMIDDALSRANRAVRECRKTEAGLEKQQTLGDSVRLYSCLELLGEDVGDLSDDINWMGGDTAQARTWPSELVVPVKEINGDTEKLFGHLLSLADIADDTCPQLRRYFH